MLIFGSLGVISGLSGALFVEMIQAIEDLVLDPVIGGGSVESLARLSFPSGARWLLLVIPATGGLITGLICSRFCPEAMGAGVGNVIDAYHQRGGHIRLRVPFVKSFTSALTIGTGGSAGIEGPIGQICAGIGAWISRLMHLSRGERQVVVMAGFAAGIGAVFHAPMAAAIFASEVLYREVDMETEVLVPSIITSTVAFAVYGSVMSDTAFLVLPPVAFGSGAELLPYLALGAVLAVSARFFIWFYRAFQGTFGFRPSIPLWLRPVLGGIGVGLVGLFFPLAIGLGGKMAQMTVDGHIGPAMLLALAGAKMLTTAMTAGMGGSGGLFAPSLIIGGALGAAVGAAAAQIAPSLVVEPAAYAVVGMAGFFAAVANAPLSTVIMVAEVVGSYSLIVPALWVCTFTWLLNRGRGVYYQQVSGRWDAPSRLPDMMGAVLHRISVDDALSTEQAGMVTVDPAMRLRDMVQLFSETTQAIFPIVGDDGRLQGVVDGQLLRRTLGESGFDELLIATDFLHAAATVRRSDTLYDAVLLMTECGFDHLVVVEEEDTTQLTGLLSRREVVSAYHRRMLASTPEVSSSPAVAGADSVAGPAGTLEAALAAGGMVTRLDGGSPGEVLRQLIEGAPLPADLDADSLLERLLEREELSSTGVGDGVALPHPHASDWLLPQPVVIVGLLDRDIDWNAFDGKPVDTVLLLLASSDREHLALLAGLARAISDPTLRKLLRRRASLGNILKRVAELERQQVT